MSTHPSAPSTSRRSRGWGGQPGLCGAPAPVRRRRASQPACLLEDGECAVDLASLLVAAEQVADLGAGDAGGAVLGERRDLVGGGVAEAVAEDPAGRVGAVAPDCEAGVEMGEGDLLVAV